jgi:hypothetical protein
MSSATFAFDPTAKSFVPANKCQSGNLDRTPFWGDSDSSSPLEQPSDVASKIASKVAPKKCWADVESDDDTEPPAQDTAPAVSVSETEASAKATACAVASSETDASAQAPTSSKAQKPIPENSTWAAAFSAAGVSTLAHAKAPAKVEPKAPAKVEPKAPARAPARAPLESFLLALTEFVKRYRKEIRYESGNHGFYVTNVVKALPKDLVDRMEIFLRNDGSLHELMVAVTEIVCLHDDLDFTIFPAQKATKKTFHVNFSLLLHKPGVVLEARKPPARPSP